VLTLGSTRGDQAPIRRQPQRRQRGSLGIQDGSLLPALCCFAGPPLDEGVPDHSTIWLRDYYLDLEAACDLIRRLSEWEPGMNNIFWIIGVVVVVLVVLGFLGLR
jgi:hypothetical protein